MSTIRMSKKTGGSGNDAATFTTTSRLSSQPYEQKSVKGRLPQEKRQHGISSLQEKRKSGNPKIQNGAPFSICELHLSFHVSRVDLSSLSITKSRSWSV
jgi:hypothetical protein